MKPPPAELAALQDDFSQLLRTPLSVKSGQLTADLSKCPARLRQLATARTGADPDAGLIIYQRQYWLRLFTVMQTELLLTSRLVGAFTFNRIASRFLLDHPPQHSDIGHVVDGFESWLPRQRALLARLKVTLPTPALHQAVSVDLAYRRAAVAAIAPPWKPSAEEAETLAGQRLQLAAHASLLQEAWPLVHARTALQRDPSPEHIALDAPAARHWAVVRTDDGFGQLRLQPRQATLYLECTRRPLKDAIAKLQQTVNKPEQASLTTKVQQWFAQGIAIGLWAGVAR